MQVGGHVTKTKIRPLFRANQSRERKPQVSLAQRDSRDRCFNQSRVSFQVAFGSMAKMADKLANEDKNPQMDKSESSKGPSDPKMAAKKGKENVPPPLTKKPTQKKGSDAKSSGKVQASLQAAWDPNAISTMPPPPDVRIPKKRPAPAAAGSQAQLEAENSQQENINVDMTQNFDPVPQYIQNQAMFTPPQQMMAPRYAQQNISPPQYAPQQNVSPQFAPQPQWMAPTQNFPVQLQSPMPYIMPIIMDSNQMKVMQGTQQVQPQGQQPDPQQAINLQPQAQEVQEEEPEPIIDLNQDFEEQLIDDMIREAEPQLQPSNEPPLLPLEPNLQEQQQPGPSGIVSVSTSSGDEDEDAWLVQEVEVAEEEVGPPVSEAIRQCFDSLWDQGVTNPENLAIKDTYASIYRPSNVETLVKTNINDEISDNLPRGIQRRDSLPKAVQNSIVKGTLGLMDLVSNLPVMRSEERKDILTRTIKIIRCLAYGNSKINLLRRLQFKPYLGPSLKKLALKPKKPSHNWLYGTEILDEVRDQEAARKISRVIRKKPSTKTYQQCGSFQQQQYRPRYQNAPRFQPYQTSYRPRFGESQFSFGFQLCMQPNLVKISPQYYSDAVKARIECQNTLQGLSNSTFSNNNIGLFASHPCQDSICRTPWWTAASGQTTGDQGPDSQVQESVDTATGSLQPDPEQVSKYMQDFPIKFNEFVAGGVSLKLKAWEQLTSDPEILDLVRGVKLEFTEKPVQNKIPNEIKFSKQEEILVRQELDKLLHLGVIQESSIQEGDWVSNIFARPKKEKNKIRILLNLKSLNKIVKYTHFKMGGVQEVLDIIRPGSYMVTIDFTHGFYSLKVHPSSQKYLKAVCLGKVFVFCMLPMGYSRSPLHFCKLLKVPLTYLRTQFGFTNSAFVDDCILIEDTFEEAKESAEVSADTFQDLGYTINVPKSELFPAQERIHQGLIINSVDMTVSLTQNKIDNLVRLSQDILHADRFSIRKLASLVGQMNAARFTLKFGPLHTKSLEIAKNLGLKRNNDDFDAVLTADALSPLDRMDIQWWIDHAPHAKNSIQLPPIDHVLYSDASTKGYGFYHVQSDTRGGGRWSESEAQHHINVLEILALNYAIRSTLGGATNIHLKVHCDSQVAIGCLRKMGTTKSFACNSATRNVLLMCEKQNITLSLTYIASEDNEIADFESRNFTNEDTEWSLNRDIFDQLCQHFNFYPEIDMFASRLNAKTSKFCSWKKEPFATCIDAFTVPWDEYEKIYIFSSFSLMSRIVKNFIALQQQQRKVTALMILPCWPTQAWYTKILTFLVSQPVIFKVIPKTLTLEHHRASIHPMVHKLRLMAGLFSSCTTEIEGFQNRYQRRSVTPEQIALTSSTVVTLASGRYIAIKNRLIPIAHLSLRY